jgi:hypothetical protein
MPVCRFSPNAAVSKAVATWSAVGSATYAGVPDKHGRFDVEEDVRHPHRMCDRLALAFSTITGRSVSAD